MKYSITIQSKHFETLKENLIRPDKKERVAFVICGRSIIKDVEERFLIIERPQITKDVEERFLSKEVHFIPEDKLITSEYNQVSWHNKYFIDVLKKAEVKNLAIILIHNHPDGVNRFSEIDDDVEYHLFKLAFNRNVGANSHASLILLTEGNFVGRVWKHDLSTEPISMIRIIGDRIKLNYPN